jgi:glutamate synthase domain-containing protein 2/glutamate synthase domain-containing protein 1/glutamate synthase domain-containing protein 3
MKDDVPQRLLYDKSFEHDACGVGFVADTSGRASHAIVETAICALGNLSHRGAVDADGKTGDGAGILAQLPRKLILREIEKLGHARPLSEDVAAGMIFLPRGDKSAIAVCHEIVESALSRCGLRCFGWRRVPLDESALGAKAAETAPLIEQVLIGKGYSEAFEFERALFLARKEIEKRASHIKGFYVPSLSSRTIVYKGLFVATQLASFYLDLQDADFETQLAIVHQRYSTNTFPNWSLAQPFRMLAHNGEINTLAGNRNWMRAREPELRSEIWGHRIERLKPVIWEDGSDSASLDNALELMTMSGRDPLHAMMMLVPEAHENAPHMDTSLRGFYEYAACLMEAWDGPAALTFSDGRFVGAALDRNGLRPARYVVTNDGLVIMSSEAGVVELDPETIIEKGRLGPGRMLAVDTERGLLLKDREIKLERAARKPYSEWVRNSMIACPTTLDSGYSFSSDDAELAARMKSFGYTLEDVQRIIEPMFEESREPVGSMGDDTPLAVLSSKPRVLYTYFKQRFAQVTNPAIDPIRERMVMSLETLIGPRGSLLEDEQSRARLIKLRSPVLTDSDIEWLRDSGKRGFRSTTIATLYGRRGGERCLGKVLNALCEQAVIAVEDGSSILILSDRGASCFQAPMPMLLAAAAVHHRLMRAGSRMKTSIIVETGEAREDHHFACLIGYGANAVNPYLAFEIVANEIHKRGMSVPGALRNYKAAVESGLLKIMAKMGIATVASYCGAQVFEALGLDERLIEKYFTGTPSRMGGAGLREIARDMLRFHEAAYGANEQPHLEDAGYYRYRAHGEYHAYNPAVFRALHKFAKTGNIAEFHVFQDQVGARPVMALRDLLEFRAGAPVAIDEVEQASKIVRRFSASAMSHGALSREAHETIAIAMNRIGARSNSGEGGEDPARFHQFANTDSANSRIKQVASARFGVTPEYLMSADELEIKIAQGAKPGEGGQLPGHKVTAEIAMIRHSVPGVTLISPPPHHDIYSIEDLAELIYDLKQVNPRARIAVKLVSEAGVGTVAAGVAKAYADVIHIAGHDGGTGASPLGSIKHVGTPWELGLAETQQTLVLNNLRGRIRLRVDGGLKTARDVVIAAMLGAEEFGFGTATVVALGCVMARQCHLNTCPVGIATQLKHLRERFAGKPEMVAEFFLSLAEEVRAMLASLGFHSLEQIIGRSDLLVEKTDAQLPRNAKLNIAPIIAQADATGTRPRRSTERRNHAPEPSLGDLFLRDAQPAIANAEQVALVYKIKNVHRAVGAKVAGEIARRHGNAGLKDGSVDAIFTGTAGQSFGAFNISGMRLTLIGETNDYVGKGMSGGEIIIRPPNQSRFDWADNVIAGNTVMYGATGGAMFVAGRAGERFCVRNSGGLAVVEGVGDHGCEYMTAGAVVVLGEVGRNFAAGMTGGVAYVLDVNRDFERNCNHELVRLERVANDHDEQTLRQLIAQHSELTGSKRAREVLWNWAKFKPRFWQVITQGTQAARTDSEIEATATDSSEPVIIAPPRRISASH